MVFTGYDEVGQRNRIELEKVGRGLVIETEDEHGWNTWITLGETDVASLRNWLDNQFDRA